MAAGIPARLTAAEGRAFAFPVAGAFLALAGFVWWREKPTVAASLATLAVVLGTLGAVAPTHLGPIQRAWMGLAHAMSKVTTPIFMGVVYFVVIAPIGLLMRAFGKNPLAAPAGQSYWRARPTGRRKGNLARQF